MLHVEGPHFRRAFSALQYPLVEEATGREVTTVPLLTRSGTSGFRSVELSIRRFVVQKAGSHLLRIDGLRAGRGKPSLAVFFSRSWPPAGSAWTVAAATGVFVCVGGMFALIGA